MNIFGETIRVEMDFWTRSDIQINSIEKANNPNVTDEVMKLLATSSPGTKLEVSPKVHKPKRAAWALIHSAYLYLSQVTGYAYAYACAGVEIRNMLKENLVETVENYCLQASEHPNPRTSRVNKSGHA